MNVGLKLQTLLAEAEETLAFCLRAPGKAPFTRKEAEHGRNIVRAIVDWLDPEVEAFERDRAILAELGRKRADQIAAIDSYTELTRKGFTHSEILPRKRKLDAANEAYGVALKAAEKRGAELAGVS